MAFDGNSTSSYPTWFDSSNTQVILLIVTVASFYTVSEIQRFIYQNSQFFMPCPCPCLNLRLPVWGELSEFYNGVLVWETIAYRIMHGIGDIGWRKKFNDAISPFDTMPECDEHMNRRTNRIAAPLSRCAPSFVCECPITKKIQVHESCEKLPVWFVDSRRANSCSSWLGQQNRERSFWRQSPGSAAQRCWCYCC